MTFKVIADRFVAMLIALLAVAGCASDYTSVPEWEKPGYWQTMLVVVQMCMPNQVVRFKDITVDLRGAPPARESEDERRRAIPVEPLKRKRPFVDAKNPGDWDIVRQWIPGSGTNEVKRSTISVDYLLDQDGIRSHSPWVIELMGDTVKNQPVFERQLYRLKDYVALGARLSIGEGVDDRAEYWFRMPRDVSETEFSLWLEPFTEERGNGLAGGPDPAWQRLLGGAPVKANRVAPDAPKIRVKLVSRRDYLDLNRFWDRARDVVYQPYRSQPGGVPDRIHFAPKRDESIPAC
jgi:hypothetical protein